MKILKYLLEFHGNPSSYFFLYGYKRAFSFLWLNSKWKRIEERIEAVDMNFLEPSSIHS